jgi:hypothetical protein
MGYLTGTRLRLNFTVWAGVCYHSFYLCDTTIEQGEPKNTSHCAQISVPTPDMDMAGVGMALRNHFTFRSALSTVLASQNASQLQGTDIVTRALGLLSMAWFLSQQQFQNKFTKWVYVQKTVSTDQDAVAMELLTTLSLLLFAFLTLTTAIWVFLHTKKLKQAIDMCQRRIRWDPMTRLASELSQKHNLSFDHGYWEVKNDNQQNEKKTKDVYFVLKDVC